MKKLPWFRLFSLCVLIALQLAILSQAATLTFGVVPQQTPKLLAEKWQPLITYLEKQTGATIVFATASDIPTFESRVAEGRYDLVYMNSFHFIQFHDAVGYRALAREINHKIQGVIIVHKDSPIQSVNELDGMTVAFAAPAAFAASIVPRAELIKMGIRVKPRYVFSHDSVYLNVSRGFFPAGGGVIKTLESAPAIVRDSVRVIWKSREFTAHAIATHPSVDEATRSEVLRSLQTLTKDRNASDILENLHFNGFEQATDADWDDVRQLGIESLARPQY